MKNSILLAALLISGLYGFTQDEKVINDAHAQKREVKGFHAIHISGGIDLYLSQGNEEAVAISASSEEYRNHIRTEVENGVLNIYLDTEGWHWGGWGDKHLRAYVSVKSLDDLHASGGSDIFIQDQLHVANLDISLSGGSDLKGKVTAQRLSLVQSGGSDIYISGTVADLRVHATGGSDFHGYDLVAEEGDVEASGGSDIRVTANKGLTVSASGGSDVYYKGTAQIHAIHTSGSSDVTRKG